MNRTKFVIRIVEKGLIKSYDLIVEKESIKSYDLIDSRVI